MSNVTELEATCTRIAASLDALNAQSESFSSETSAALIDGSTDATELAAESLKLCEATAIQQKALSAAEAQLQSARDAEREAERRAAMPPGTRLIGRQGSSVRRDRARRVTNSRSTPPPRCSHSRAK